MSDKMLLELYDKVNNLEERVKNIEKENIKLKINIKSSNKYRYLSKYLVQSKRDIVKLSFYDIEKILNIKLPQSAYKHRSFWANTESHSIALSWLSVSFNTTEVDMKAKTVQFERR